MTLPAVATTHLAPDAFLNPITRSGSDRERRRVGKRKYYTYVDTKLSDTSEKRPTAHLA